MPLQKSQLIERKQLHYVSHRSKGQNPLKLASPINFVGGDAFATLENVVAHITIKEDSNIPLPNYPEEELVIWKFKTKSLYIVSCLEAKDGTNKYKHDKGIPIFWQPSEQKLKDPTKKNGGRETKVQYCGHWKLKNLEHKNESLMGYDRCAKIMFTFDRYDQEFDRIIAAASAIPADDILKHDFGSVATSSMAITIGDSPGGSSSSGSAKKRKRSAAKSTKAEHNNSDDEGTKKKSATKSAPKRKHNLDRSDDNVGTRKASPAARGNVASLPASSAASPRAATASAKKEHGTLEDYNAHQVSRLVAAIGPAFQKLAKAFKDFGFTGKKVVEQVNKGEDEFYKFLQQSGVEVTLWHSISLLGTFRDEMKESS